MLRVTAMAIVSAGLGGCVMPPVVGKLSPEDQAAVDAAWNRMFDPVHRLDRTALLDAVLLGNLWFPIGAGQDRATMRAEKDFAGGTVVTELRHDRAAPQNDTYTVTVFDRSRRVVRRESWYRAELENAAGGLSQLKARKAPEDGRLPPSQRARLMEENPDRRDIGPPPSDPTPQERAEAARIEARRKAAREILGQWGERVFSPSR
jgi:hypothetical protein